MTDPIPFSTVEQHIHDRFEKIAAGIPDNPAVSGDGQTLSYRELDLLSNKMAHAILGTLGSGSGNIAILITNNVYQVIAILGVLKSGRSYVPLDPSFPEDRNKFILEDSGAKMLISSQHTKEEAHNITNGIHLLMADSIHPGTPESRPQTTTLPTANAITLYTSGSTGQPKGVLQSHRNMVHFIMRMTKQYPFSPDDKVAYFLSSAFSAHALPLLGALLNGGELITYDFKAGNFLAFSTWMQERKISIILMLPSFLRSFLAVQNKRSSYPGLRLLMLAGETLYRSDVEKANKIFTDTEEIVNLYASTEAYLMRSYAIRKDTVLNSNIVPIGYEVEGMDLKIINDLQKKAAVREQGELILRSEFLSEGYWNRPERQEQDFSTDRQNEKIRIFRTSDMAYELEDGCLVHSGRKDAMVKLRGYRIELGEIINILLQNNAVKEATCSLRTDPSETEHIISYVVPLDPKDYDEELLRGMLVRLLPDYMIPSHILSIEELPKNNTGKINFQALPDPDWQSGQMAVKEKPADNIEKKLVQIFEKVLKISPLGTNENFLKIGANSLGLFVAFSEVEKMFHIKIDIKSTVDNPNIKSLAKLIRNKTTHEKPSAD